MNIEELRAYCIQKKGVTESFPFDETTLVFKVMNKMFLLTDLENEFSMNVKCEPERAIELRERFSAVTPGYHMSKTHWNTVLIDGSIDDTLLFQWVDDSYGLVVDSLPKRLKQELQLMR